MWLVFLKLAVKERCLDLSITQGEPDAGIQRSACYRGCPCAKWRRTVCGGRSTVNFFVQCWCVSLSVSILLLSVIAPGVSNRFDQPGRYIAIPRGALLLTRHPAGLEIEKSTLSLVYQKLKHCYETSVELKLKIQQMLKLYSFFYRNT